MNEETFHLGIDIAKATLRAALLASDGSWREADFPNNHHGHTRLLGWLGEGRERVRACLESTGPYGVELTARLHAEGVPVSVVNPRLVRDFAKSLNCRTKNDPVDARVIARYSRERLPEPWSPPSQTTARLRSLFARRDDLVRMSVAERNRLEGAGDEARRDIEEHLAWLAGRIVSIDRGVAELIAADPVLKDRAKLLRSIPGVGAQTAGRLLGLIDMNRFGSARSLAAHAGVTPCERESGTSVHGRPHMGKIGHPELRRALYMPSLSARNGPGFASWVRKLRAAGKPERLILGAVMHRLVRIAYGVLKSGEPYSASKIFGHI